MTDPATLYEAWFVPAVFAPSARQLLDRVAIAPDARVLDIACGSGIVARTVARRLGPAGRVIGLDASPAMLAAARRASEAERLAIEWREGDAQELPFADASFDLVLCQHGLQFFPNRARALAEMHRVLAPGGHVAVATWRGLDQHPFLAAYVRAVRQRFEAAALEAPFALGDPARVAALLLDAGFRDVSVEPLAFAAEYAEPERFVEYQTQAAAAVIPALNDLTAAELDALIGAVRGDLEALVRAATAGDRLRIPTRGIVARGRRG